MQKPIMDKQGRSLERRNLEELRRNLENKNQ